MSAHRPLSEGIQIDDGRDIVTVFGVQIAGALFRALGEPTPPGQWLRVINTDGGVATIERRHETHALTRLAESIERQAQALDTLAHVIASQYVQEGEDAQEATTYLDGTPRTS